ncbi:helix-turn-helix transcriptional regulator [Candidatus Pacearchaeota archaeon]|nr:helix-turn-helix transcriptional regulator [Candidatus Pacearchaeota archaeon]
MSKGIRIRFAERLRKLRLKKKWTQEELAEYADLSYRHIQRLESLKNPPPAKIDTIEKLAKAFKITPSKLIDFK